MNNRFIFDGTEWTTVHHRYEYGVFNADEDKICAAHNTNPQDEGWKWLYESPINLRSNMDEAEELVEKLNSERESNGLLETHGPVEWRKRLVSYGPWVKE